jgi:hypothetical protein
MKVSDNFDSDEFACSCGCGQGSGWADESIPEALLDMDDDLIEGLQTLRDNVGVPVVIVSGARCQAVNDSIPNAAPHSQHLENKAADIAIPGWTMAMIYDELVKVQQFNHGGIGIGHGIVHVDTGEERRWSYDACGQQCDFVDPRGADAIPGTADDDVDVDADPA